jgi:serine/threonine protein kinase
MPVDPIRVRDLFLAAAELPAPDRAAYLSASAGDDAELRAAVQRLLVAHEQPAPVLVGSAPGVPHDAAPPPAAGGATVDSPAGQPQTVDHADPSARVGAVLAGKYKLVEEIGEGGMGSVFLAQQIEPVKRAVAVKVIKAGMDSRELLARFEAERQALAMMDHPHIARVLDAGTTEGGRPFFVMELVKGTPITRYCDEHKLTPRQRLELFVPVCQAIQHAHQKGIIHRDIKPSNVLVAMYDDRPVPKVIDFGVAKAAGQSLTEKTLMTGFGAIVGTPEYMSPEQASLNNLDIDTRSDVYSLGVLLYELLTGTTPVDKKSLGKAALLEILRIVREVEAPRPSAKLSTMGTLPSVAANRGTEPARLSRLMKGELDWLVLKALEKDRARRYETANALSRDIQRYLADEVVEARPPSVGYRVSKFVRRHKGHVIAASLVLLALVGGIVGTTLGLFEARRQQEEAKKQEKITRDETAEKEKANKELLNVGARGLLRPLGAQVQPNLPLPLLIDQEVEPLWELAAATEEGLRLRFVELALDDPVLRRRLKDRAPFALQAAVGLYPARRKRVEELLGKRLEASEVSAEEQEQVAFCLAHLGGLEPRLAERTAATLTQAMSKTTDLYALRELAQALAAVAVRLEPKEAARVCGQAAATLIKAMSKNLNPHALQSQAQGLSAVAACLEPTEAAQLCGQAAAILIQVTRRSWPAGALEWLVEGLSALSARLEPQEAAELAATLIQAMSNKTTAWSGLGSLAQALSAVSARLQPKEATKLAATLTQAMSKTTNPYALQSLAQGLSAVAARLEPKEGAATLTQAMSKTSDPHQLGALAQGLSAVDTRMERKESDAVCVQAAATLTQALTKTTDVRAYTLAKGLSAVSARLEAKEAAALAATLTQALIKARYAGRLVEPLAKCMSAVSARVEAKEAAELAAILIQAMSSKSTDLFQFTLRDLAQALSALAVRLEPKEAARICGQAAATLTQAMSKATQPGTLGYLAQGLSAVAARLEPKEAARVCGEAAATLTQAMSKTTHPNALAHLAEGLSAVAARLEPKGRCGQAAATLIQAMSKANPDAWGNLPQGLAAVLARELPPQTLVDLLKHPCCVGEARRLVLDQLARHYHRPFADQWDFVDYVQQKKLCRDLTTPPARSGMLP